MFSYFLCKLYIDDLTVNVEFSFFLINKKQFTTFTQLIPCSWIEWKIISSWPPLFLFKYICTWLRFVVGTKRAIWEEKYLEKNWVVCAKLMKIHITNQNYRQTFTSNTPNSRYPDRNRWFIHGTKHHKKNQLLNQKHSRKLSVIYNVNPIKYYQNSM